MADDTVNHFIDWASEFYNPPWQANDFIPVVAGQITAFDVLNAAEVAPALQIEYEGAGQGLYIAAINGVRANQQGNGYWWVYLVNGNDPKISCAAYKVSAGDSIAWDYKHFSSGLRQAGHPSLK
jgi:hypothetical protein